jgi:molybdopterin molybdotransferase
LLQWEEARDRVLKGVAPMPTETVPLGDAHGLVLAEDAVAKDAMPPFDNSAMDGFAVQHRDLVGASNTDPAALRVLDVLGAGRAADIPVEPGTAIRVMTGAPIPPGADAVVQVEWTEYWDPETKRAKPGRGDHVKIYRTPSNGQNIRRTGESVAAGDSALKAGHPLRAVELSLLISVGCEQVIVYRRPRVAVLSTGNELIESGPLKPGQIRDSNRPGLLARLQELGFDTLDCGMSGDTPEALEEKILYGIAGADFLITSGGVSVGDFDFTRDVLDKLGNVAAYQVGVKPGKPQVFGHINNVPVFGLPGNPVSSLVVFEIFVLPALLKMAGIPNPLPKLFDAKLTSTFKRKAGRVELVRVHLDAQDGQWMATPTGRQGSGVLSSMTKANGYAVLGADSSSLEPGTSLACMFMA